MMRTPKIKSRFLVFIITCFLGAGLVACSNTPANVVKSRISSVNSKTQLGLLLQKAQAYPGGFRDDNTSETTMTPGIGENDPKGTDRDYVGTNEQVDGVSEADIIKTDGYEVYSLAQRDGTLRVFDVGDDHTITLKKKIVIEEVFADSLYLTPHYLVVIGTKYNKYEPQPSIWGGGEIGGWYLPSSVVSVVSRQSFEVVYELVNENNELYSHRLINDSLYLVGSHYGHPAMEEYRPTFTINGEKTQYIDYKDIYYFEDTLIGALTKIIGVKLAADPDNITVSGKAYLGAAHGYKQIYMTTTDLYISDTNYYYDEKTFFRTMTISQHKLLLDKADSEFVAAGVVAGGMLNQFAMDAYNGYLRVATGDVIGTHQEEDERFVFRSKVVNHLYILRVNVALQAFNIISHLDEGIGKPNEMIMSVRFDQEKAYIVTFLRTDPLYVIDLSDPEKPLITDAIELPGYDVYQHAWGENNLLGFGYEADENGFVNGMKLTAYQVTSGEAREIQTHPIKPLSKDDDMFSLWRHSEGLYNHKALFVSVKDNLFGFPYYEWVSIIDEEGNWTSRGTSVYFIFKIDMSATEPIVKLLQVEHPHHSRGTTEVRRSILIANHLYFFSDTHVSVYNIASNELGAPIAIP